MTDAQPGADDGRPDGMEHGPGCDLYRSGPPNREPLILSDKFVTPADAIVWLDPETLQPLKVQPDMEAAAVLARFDPCDEAEIVDDDWTPVSLNLWYSLPPDSAEFGVLIPGPFTVTHDDRTVENGMWLRWRAVEGDGIWVQYDTVSRLREWPLTAVTPTAAGIVLTKDDGGTAIVALSEVSFEDLRKAIAWWTTDAPTVRRVPTLPPVGPEGGEDVPADQGRTGRHRRGPAPDAAD